MMDRKLELPTEFQMTYAREFLDNMLTPIRRDVSSEAQKTAFAVELVVQGIALLKGTEAGAIRADCTRSLLAGKAAADLLTSAAPQGSA